VRRANIASINGNDGRSVRPMQFLHVTIPIASPDLDDFSILYKHIQCSIVGQADRSWSKSAKPVNKKIVRRLGHWLKISDHRISKLKRQKIT